MRHEDEQGPTHHGSGPPGAWPPPLTHTHGSTVDTSWALEQVMTPHWAQFSYLYDGVSGLLPSRVPASVRRCKSLVSDFLGWLPYRL